MKRPPGLTSPLAREELDRVVRERKAKKWNPEFLIGDSVTALPRRGRNAKKRISGVLTNLDCGVGDTLVSAVVHTAEDRFVQVQPKSLRYRTGLHGFASKVNADGSITFYRNDAKMLDPKWWTMWPVRKWGRIDKSGAAKLRDYVSNDASKKLRKSRAR